MFRFSSALATRSKLKSNTTVNNNRTSTAVVKAPPPVRKFNRGLQWASNNTIVWGSRTKEEPEYEWGKESVLPADYEIRPRKDWILTPDPDEYYNTPERTVRAMSYFLALLSYIGGVSLTAFYLRPHEWHSMMTREYPFDNLYVAEGFDIEKLEAFKAAQEAIDVKNNWKVLDLPYRERYIRV